MSIFYPRDDSPTLDELMTLYASVGWTAYTESPERLQAAIAASLKVSTARENGRLIGLARVVGDGSTIAYLQDILITPDHQGFGIGGELFRRVFEPFAQVRQKVLITDDEPGQHAFYESMGFTATDDREPRIRTFVRFS